MQVLRYVHDPIAYIYIWYIFATATGLLGQRVSSLRLCYWLAAEIVQRSVATRPRGVAKFNIVRFCVPTTTGTTFDRAYFNPLLSFILPLSSRAAPQCDGTSAAPSPGDEAVINGHPAVAHLHVNSRKTPAATRRRRHRLTQL